MAKGITFYGFPNETIIGYVFMFSIFTALMIVRLLYIFMERRQKRPFRPRAQYPRVIGPALRVLHRFWFELVNNHHSYPNDEVYLAVLAAKWVKILALPMMAVLLILAVRVSPGIAAGQFWVLDSVSRGWWCIIRIMIGAMAALCCSVFDAHFVFRAWPSLTLPLLTVLDLLSESNFATQISCIEHGLCATDTAQLGYLYAVTWRDIVSAWLSLTYFGVVTWAWFIFGVLSNDLPMPREELRLVSARLDKIRVKPKETRRNKQEENQLEKMLGY